MTSLGRATLLIATVLLFPNSLLAIPIISVTAPPALSELIGSSGEVISTSWSQSSGYTDVSIAVLVDSSFVGQTPTATAYLTTRIGAGTTVADEIAHAQFTVPALLPVCSGGSCGAFVTVLSGLVLGPGDYFLTLGAPESAGPLVGWFPALRGLNPTVIVDDGVTEGPAFIKRLGSALYPPASSLGMNPDAMNFVVTGTPQTVPEPASLTLVGLGATVLGLWRRRRRG